jgi:hypothetical protein
MVEGQCPGYETTPAFQAGRLVVSKVRARDCFIRECLPGGEKRRQEHTSADGKAACGWVAKHAVQVIEHESAAQGAPIAHGRAEQGQDEKQDTAIHVALLPSS